MKGNILISTALFVCFSIITSAQNKQITDSLKVTLTTCDTLSEHNRILILDKISNNATSADEILFFAEQMLKISSKNKYFLYKIKAYRHMGVAYRLKGALKKSLGYLFKAAQMASEQSEYNELSICYLDIANTYTSNRQFRNALVYENKAIQIIRKLGNSKRLAKNLLNAGYSYYTLNELDSALLYYNEAEPIFQKTNMELCEAYTIGNRAMVYLKKKDYPIAERDLLKAIEMLRPLGDEYAMADYHNQLARLYAETQKDKQSIIHAEKALAMAQGQDLKEQIRDASLLLSELYERKKDYKQALQFQQRYVAFRDSIESAEKTKEMADLRTEFEVGLKEKEIVLLEKDRALQRGYMAVAVILFFLAVALLLYFRQRFVHTRLMAEHQRKIQDDKIENLLWEQEAKAMQSLVVGREEERRRIAQELHNHLGSLLATIKVNLNAIDEKDIPNYPTIASLVDQACSDVRGMSHSLNMGISEDFGLVPALKDLVAHLQQSGKIEVEFNASMQTCQLDTESEIFIYRIVQELVSNVLKHAHASRLSVLLTCFSDENLVNIIVQDNGKGFEIADDGGDTQFEGMGIASIRQMVLQRQGEIHFDSHPTGGTTVNIDLPILNDFV